MSDVVTEYRHIREALDERWSLRRKLGVVFEILAVYARARWLLTRNDFADALDALREQKAGTALPELDQQLVGVRLGRAVERTLAHFPADSRCLIKSLVLVRLLARRGIHASLIIGVRRSPRFKAHAWVEKGAVPLLADHGDAYERFAEL